MDAASRRPQSITRPASAAAGARTGSGMMPGVLDCRWLPLGLDAAADDLDLVFVEEVLKLLLEVAEVLGMARKGVFDDLLHPFRHVFDDIHGIVLRHQVDAGLLGDKA